MKLLAQDGGGSSGHIRGSNRLENTPNMIADYDELQSGKSCLRRRFWHAHNWSASDEDPEGRRESCAQAA